MKADVAIVGAGIAGASLAAEIAGRASVVLIEGEAVPGYHATGRSAAFWSETYGGAYIQPLTSASGAFLAKPPPAFAERSFLSPRGELHIARDDAGRAALDALGSEFAGADIAMARVGRTQLEKLVPGLLAGWDSGLWERSCTDIDVAALQAAYLKAARRCGAALMTGARLERAERRGGRWLLETAAGAVEAGILVDAAGAWADEVAALAGIPPIGIQPYRRTIAQLRVDPPAPPDLPLVVDALGEFYFKPDAGGRLWLSPHDETPCAPCDCAADEHDVALAIDRLGQAVDWGIERVEHKWAGLRSFAADRLPVYGYDPAGEDFFWCAGQGGFGIQTAPAAARLAAAMLLGQAPDPMVVHINAEPYSVGRFRN